MLTEPTGPRSYFAFVPSVPLRWNLLSSDQPTPPCNPRYGPRGMASAVSDEVPNSWAFAGDAWAWSARTATAAPPRKSQRLIRLTLGVAEAAKGPAAAR